MKLCEIRERGKYAEKEVDEKGNQSGAGTFDKCRLGYADLSGRTVRAD